MYRIFLSLRYLRTRLLAVFAAIAVTLCAFMLIVAISVMNGFVNKLEDAAKGLFGDVIIEATSASGFGLYDEFIAEITDPNTGVKGVEAASPFIVTEGLLRVPAASDFQRVVKVAGIRLPERMDVTDLRDGLWAQRNLQAPSFDPNLSTPIRRIRQEISRTRRFVDELAEILDQKRRRVETLRGQGANAGDLRPALIELAEAEDNFERASSSVNQLRHGMQQLQRGQPYQQRMRETWEAITELRENRASPQDSNQMLDLLDRLDELVEVSGLQPPGERAIIGARIPGFNWRADFGQTVRAMAPGHDLTLMVFPIGRQISQTDISLPKRRFTVIDEIATDIYQIDSEYVFIPFRTAQLLNEMTARYSVADPNRVAIPARCSSVHVKLAAALGENEPAMQETAKEIQSRWIAFREENPLVYAGSDVNITTWRQRQARMIAPIQAQRTLVAIMFTIMSVVAPFAIFVIFYMIVVQKTKDIGVLKAIGASDLGVASIFLFYGALLGVAGSLLGLVGGYFFIRHINPIHEWMGRAMGFQVWTPETFLFTEIPNQVDWSAALMIMVGSAAAGILGAAIPAIHAARMQPVEALRYE
jgi:lipoprotein-releasing system permease protein